MTYAIGDKELAIRFDEFPAALHDRLTKRMREITATLEAAVEAAAPYRTGLLKSEVTGRVFSNDPNRVAGYVSVYAPDVPGEYAKAATLEYGSNKPRAVRDTSSGLFRRLTGSSRRIQARLSGPVHIEAFRYLRGPLEELRPEIEAGLAEAVAEAEATMGASAP